jgi:hypothetical protein
MHEFELMEATDMAGAFGTSFQELERESGVSQWTWRRLADKNEIRTINIGARRLIPADEVARIQRDGVGTGRKRKAEQQRLEPARRAK